MRVLKLITLSMLVSKTVFSQEVIATPKTPSTYSSIINTSSNSVTNGDITSSSSSSVSISDNKKTYKFKSKFDSSQKEGIIAILKDKLGFIKLNKKGNEIIWIKKQDGIVVFECKLSKKNLNIISNKNELSSSFNTKIYNLGEDLNNFISGKKIRLDTQNEARTLSSAEIRVEKAKVELERSIKNLERVKRE